MGKLVVTIAIPALNNAAVLVRNALHHRALFLDVETPACPNGDPPNMNTGLLAGRHSRHHHVAGAETFDRLLAREIATREAKGIQARPLIAPTSRALDTERRLAPVADRVDVGHLAMPLPSAMLHSSFGLRLAVARFVPPVACLLLPLAEQRTEEAFAGASCTSVQRSAVFCTKPGQSGLLGF